MITKIPKKKTVCNLRSDHAHFPESRLLSKYWNIKFLTDFYKLGVYTHVSKHQKSIAIIYFSKNGFLNKYLEKFLDFRLNFLFKVNTIVIKR